MEPHGWVGGGGSRLGGGGRPRRAPAIATASAAAIVAVVLLMTVAAVVGSPHARPTGAAGALPSNVRAAAATAAGGAAPPPADPVTDAWVAGLRKAAAAALPPLPSADLFRRHDGLFTLHAGLGLAAGQVLLEVGRGQLDEAFLLATEFSALDEGVRTGPTETGLNRRVNLAAFSPDRVYAFRLARHTTPPTLELYHPPLGERSVDPASVSGGQAVAGISASTVHSFPARPVGNRRLLIDVGPWVSDSFFLSGFANWTAGFVGGAAHPRSVTFHLRATDADGSSGTLKVTAVGLPRQRMTPRPLDDRIGYLNAPFSWIDDYEATRPASGAHIFKWDLAKHPVLKYYVDPSVPRSLWPAVVEGVHRWNPAFAAAGHRSRSVLRAVVPTDADWPADYAADDARFSTISFVPGTDATALGIPSVDPRTGEILSADIIMPDDMLRSFSTYYRLWYGSGSEERVFSRTGEAAATTPTFATRAASTPGRPMAGSVEDYLYQQVAAFTTHEVGHTLGLRHNYRGSAGIPWSQLTNTSFIQTHGLTTSVMDYLPAGPLPRPSDGTPVRYFATPMLGAYDFAAIRYGYTDWRTEGEARAFAESVAASGLAFGVDEDVDTDALTERFDLSATPLEWHRHLVRAVQQRMRQLGRAAGRRPTVSAVDLNDSVQSLLNDGVGSVLAAAKLVGATVIDRRRTGGATPAVAPLDAATEEAAARWVLAQLHPTDGLLSAATVADVAPHLLVAPAAACGGDASCLGRAPAALATTLHAHRGRVLSTLLEPSRLARLTANAAAAAAAAGAAAADDAPRRRLTVGALLAAVSETFFGPRWTDLAPPATVTGGALFRADAQAGWVATLTALAAPAAADGGSGDGQQSAAVAAAAAGELSRVADAVAAAVVAAPDSTHLRGLRLATAAFVVA